MKKIAIIGAGRLGSRYLQGIAKSSFNIKIEVIAFSKISKSKAKQRYEEIENNNFIKEISFYDSIEKLSEEIDLAIVTTCADIRYEVVNELLMLR